MNIVFIGCVAFSKACLQTLIALSQRHSSLHITGVVTKQSSPFNADFCDIAPLARTHNIKAFYTTDINDASTRDFIISCAPDIIYCFGWSALIKQALLDLCPIIGYHPAALPHNRGRHPIIWALALGLKESASSFFVMDSGADSGAILSQVPFAIESSDNAASLCARVERIAKEQIEDFTLDILERANASLANTKIGGNTESSAQNAQFSQLTGGGQIQILLKSFHRSLSHKITAYPISGESEVRVMA